MRDASTHWLALLALGAVHGINPAMGWLFAVGRGLQQRDRRAVWSALGPLAVGHAIAICCAIGLALAVGQVLPLVWLRWVVALSLVAVGLDGLMHHRHVRLGGMRVGSRELATWSFLMASAHGAGLMVLPFVLGTAPSPAGAMHHHHTAWMTGGAVVPPLAAGMAGFDAIKMIAPLVHTAGYLLVTVVLAVVVYEKVGLKILRRAWINVNVFWSAALIAAGAAAVLL
jgi:hypothetical protein